MSDDHNIGHWAEIVGRAWSDAADRAAQAASSVSNPSVLYRPRLTIDGNQWCALYGNNLQDGVAGFGDSPALAMEAFDRAWYAKGLTP